MSSSLRDRAHKGVAWTALKTVGSNLSSFLVFVVLARLIEPEAFGLVAVANVVLALLQVFVAQGVSASIIQREVLEREHLDAAFWFNLALGVGFAGVAIGLSGVIAEVYGEPEVRPIISALSILIVIASLSQVQMGLLRRQLKFRQLTARVLIGQLVGGVVGVGMALTGWGVWSLVGRELAAASAQLLTLWGASGWRPRLRFSVRHFKDIFGFSVYMFGANLLDWVYRKADQALIGYFLGTTALGYYAVAMRLIRLLRDALSGTIQEVVNPVFSRMQSDDERLLKTFYSATQLMSVVAFPGFVGVAVFAPELVAILFGERWLDIVPLVQILSVLGLVQSLRSFQESLIVAKGKANWRLGLRATLAASSIAVFFVAVPWGLSAVAMAYVLVALLLSPLWFLAVRRLLPVTTTTYVSKTAAAMLASIVMALSVTAVEPLVDHFSVAGDLLASASAGALIYGLVMRFGYPEVFKELHATLGHVVATFRIRRSRDAGSR